MQPSCLHAGPGNTVMRFLGPLHIQTAVNQEKPDRGLGELSRDVIYFFSLSSYLEHHYVHFL